MLVIVWPLLIAVLGFLLNAFAANVNVKHVGDIMLCCGVFWCVYLLTGSIFQIGHG